MDEFEERLAAIRRHADEAKDAHRAEADAAAAQRQADWAKIFRAAQWALAEYQRARIGPQPILREWSEIKPGPQKRVRQLSGNRKFSMAVPEYIRRSEQIAEGYPLLARTHTYDERIPNQGPGDATETKSYSYVLMITTAGPAVWCAGSYLMRPLGSENAMLPWPKIPYRNGPIEPDTLSRHAVTEWYDGNPDQVVDSILLRVEQKRREVN